MNELDTAEGLFRAIRDWSARTFPRSTLESTYEHLKREVNDELGANLSDPAELADLQHLLIQLARLADVDLLAATREKFAENLTRTWQEPDAQGVVEHVR